MTPSGVLHEARRWWREAAALAALVPLLAAVYFAAHWLRFDGELGDKEWRKFSATAALVVGVQAAVLALCGVCRDWGRLLEGADLLRLARAAAVAALAVAAADYLALPRQDIPRSVFLLDAGATVLAVAGLRLAAQHGGQLLRQFRRSDQVLSVIVGPRAAAELLWHNLRRSPRPNCRILGRVGVEGERGSRVPGGLPVLGTLPEACRAARAGGAKQLLVCGELPGRQVRAILDDAARHGLAVRVVPSYEQLLEGRVELAPRTVSIEDLLRREPVELDLRAIDAWVAGRRVLVTGSAGSIGAEICRRLAAFGPERLILVERSENGLFFQEQELRAAFPELSLAPVLADAGDRTRMAETLREHAPQVILHAAAYKHVPLLERHPGEAVRNIVAATRGLAELAAEHGVASFVLISTDKAVAPASVMGACKQLAERCLARLARQGGCRFVSVRFGNVLDSAGSVVQVFREQIARRGPLTITDPRMERYFMTIPEAAQLVLQAGAMGQSGDVFLLDMGEPVRIVDLAEDMIRLSGLRPGEDIALEIVGPRPGEKLREALHGPDEIHQPTRHPKIRRVVVGARARPDDGARLAALEAASAGPADELRRQLEELVPELATPMAAELAAKELTADEPAGRGGCESPQRSPVAACHFPPSPRSGERGRG